MAAAAAAAAGKHLIASLRLATCEVQSARRVSLCRSKKEKYSFTMGRLIIEYCGYLVV